MVKSQDWGSHLEIRKWDEEKIPGVILIFYDKNFITRRDCRPLENPRLVTWVEYLLSDFYDPLMGIQFLDAWIYISMIRVD